MITCQEFVDFLMRYLDGELSAGESSSFEHHLRACPPCEVYLDTYRETVTLGRGLCADPDGPLPEDVPEELVAAILSAARSGG